MTRAIKGPLWTPERDALLRQLVAEGKFRSECVAPLAKLPGRSITKASQISARMHRLGLCLSPASQVHAWRRGGQMRASKWGEPTWTAQRDALLREAYPTDEPLADLLVRLNRLPGRQIPTTKPINLRARALGLRRYRRKADRTEAWLDQRRATRRQQAAIRRDRSAPAPAPIAAPAVAPAPSPGRLQPACSPDIADAALAARQAKARDQLARPGAEPWAVANRTGLPLREVMRLQGELRRSRA